MTDASVGGGLPGDSLPKGLIVGTTIFAVLAAAAVGALVHMGRSQTEEADTQNIEGTVISVSPEDLKRGHR